jgi:uncharacterized repeat protein (TIGR03803 family)
MLLLVGGKMNARFSLLLVFAAYSVAEAGTLNTIYTFGPEGWKPSSGVVVGPGGVLYGTTEYGGDGKQYGSGTVYSLTPPAAAGGPWTASFYAFPFAVAGAAPFGGVAVGAGGVLYGTTTLGGSCGDGTVFELRPPAPPSVSWAEKVLLSACDVDEPSISPVIGPNGALYVNAGGLPGGCISDVGAIFTLSPPNSGSGGPWIETVLYSGPSFCPNAIVRGAHGVLYGTIEVGGAYGVGSVYSLTPPTTPGDAWIEATLYNFTGSGGDGANPSGVTIGPNGVLYGVTENGGDESCDPPYGCGTVFSLTPPAYPGGAWTKTILHIFTGGSDGAHLSGALAIGRYGVLYGATGGGGTSCPDDEDGCGTIFSLTPPASPGGGWTEAILYCFTGGSDGSSPLGVVIGPDGVLYGTTLYSNSENIVGTVFSLAP